MKKILYLDCFNGISGDMFIGAMIDLGVDKEFIANELKKLNLDEFTLDIRRESKCGIFGVKFDVNLAHVHSGHHVHRNINDIYSIIDDSELGDDVKELSKRIFMEIAVAEGKIHGKAFDQVHFHEVGAVDSIVDIVGAAICMDHIKPDMVISSVIMTGEGTVRCAHGIMPVPAPATLEILKGVPISTNGVKSELTTPTGAAIVKVISHEFGPMSEMSVNAIGYGLGTKDFDIPNVLRVILGESNINSKKL